MINGFPEVAKLPGLNETPIMFRTSYVQYTRTYTFEKYTNENGSVKRNTFSIDFHTLHTLSPVNNLYVTSCICSAKYNIYITRVKGELRAN